MTLNRSCTTASVNWDQVGSILLYIAGDVDLPAVNHDLIDCFGTTWWRWQSIAQIKLLNDLQLAVYKSMMSSLIHVHTLLNYSSPFDSL